MVYLINIILEYLCIDNAIDSLGANYGNPWLG